MSTAAEQRATLHWGVLWQGRGARVPAVGLSLAVLALFLPWVGGSSTTVHVDYMLPTETTTTTYGESAFATGGGWIAVALLAVGVLGYVSRRPQEPQKPVVSPYLSLAGAGGAWLVGLAAVAQNYADWQDTMIGSYGSYYPEPAYGALLFSAALPPFLWRLGRFARQTRGAAGS